MKQTKKYTKLNAFAYFLCLVVYAIIYLPLKILLLFSCSLKVEGKRNLKALKKSGCVVCCNHVYFLDCVIMSTNLLPRVPRILVLKANAEHKVVGGLVRLLRAIALPEDPGEMFGFMKEIIAELKKGETIGVYPEAHLVTNSPSLRHFENGAFFMAHRAGVPVLPTAVCYRLNKRKTRILYTYKIGQPIMPKQNAKELEQEVRLEMEKMTEGNAEVVKEFLLLNPNAKFNDWDIHTKKEKLKKRSTETENAVEEKAVDENTESANKE